MNIAFNTSFTEPFYQNSYSHFVSTCIPFLAEKFPEHNFHLIGNRIKIKTVHKNIKASIFKTKIKNHTISDLLYNYRISQYLKKNKIDTFINVPEKNCRKTTVPQLYIVFETSILHHSLYKTKRIKIALQKSKSIVTNTKCLKEIITEKFLADTNKITIIDCILNNLYQPATIKEKISIQEKYSQGKEYFLFFGEPRVNTNLFNLLKAFSVFKKMQKSNMQLVIASPEIEMHKAFTDSLKTYKYREDVVIIPNINEAELVHLTASAYTIIHNSTNEYTSYYLLNALYCEAPVIATKTKRMEALFGDAILFSETENFKDLADKMMLVFKDESLRNDLIKRSIRRSKQINSLESVEAFWQTILSVANH